MKKYLISGSSGFKNQFGKSRFIRVSFGDLNIFPHTILNITVRNYESLEKTDGIVIISIKISFVIFALT